MIYNDISSSLFAYFVFIYCNSKLVFVIQCKILPKGIFDSESILVFALVLQHNLLYIIIKLKKKSIIDYIIFHDFLFYKELWATFNSKNYGSSSCKKEEKMKIYYAV